jgi:hypothetical protein
MIGESHGAKHLWHSIAIHEKFEMHLYDVIHFYLSLY